MVSYKYLASDGNFTYRSPLGIETSRSNSDLTSHGVFAKGTWSFGEEALPKSLSMSGQYFHQKGGSPGAIDQLKPLARKKNQNESINLVYEQKLGSPYNSVRFQTYYQNSEFLFDDPDPYIPEHAYNHSIAAGAELQGRVVLNVWNAATSGYAYRGDRVSSTSFEGKRERGLHSIYLQDEFSPFLPEGSLIRRIVAIPAVRWDRFSDFGGRLSPKIGVVLSTGDPWQASFKTNYGSSFRAPSFNDLYWPKDSYSKGNPDLKPERGRDFDIGVMFRNPSLLGMGVDLTFFSNSVEELILWQPNALGIWTPENVGKASIKGVETRVSVNPWKDLLHLEWNYTYLDARNKTEEANQIDRQLPYRPKNVHNLSARVDLSWFYLLANVSYSGKRYTNTANTVTLEPYHASNILTGYKPPFTPQWLEMKLEVKNLEDLEYQMMDGFPMPGREYRFSIEVKLSHDKETNQTPEEHTGNP